MKHIKTFEHRFRTDKLENLADYLISFISECDNDDIIVHITKYDGDYLLYYTVKEIQNKYFMNMKINRANNEIFKFNIDNMIENPGWINEKITNISLFINSIMNKYKKLNDKINFSDIDNIINDINKENYEIYLNSLKFNI